MTRSLQWLGALDFGRITVPMRVKAPRCPQPGARCGWKWHALEGVVDTGSTTLGLPENLVNELGLVPTSFREARTAGGLKRLPCIDELELEILGRSMRSDAIVTPPGGMALVGHKQLAELNLLIDARKGEVRVGVGALPEPFAPTKSLNDVIPALRPRFEALLAQAIAWGMKPEIRSAGRTCEQQNEQLKLGYSQASMCRSMHTLGHAVDLNLSPSTCATYTKLGEWWEAQGGIWGGRWTGDKFGPCGDAGHFHYGFDKAQAVPTSICPSTVTLAECKALRQTYLEQQFAAGGGSSSGGGAGGTSPWTLAAWAAVLGAGWLIFRGTLGVKPGSKALRSNPGERAVGFSWNSPKGERVIKAERQHPSTGEPIYLIETAGQFGTVLLPQREIEEEIRRDTANYESRFKRQSEQALQQVAQRQADSWYGFIDQISSPPAKKKALGALSKIVSIRGALAQRGTLLRSLYEEGFRVVEDPRQGRILRDPSGSFFFEKDVTKTGLDFVEYLTRTRLGENPRRGTGWVSDLLTKRDACKEAMLAHYENDGMVVVEIREGWRISLMPSTRKGVAYQITFWNAGGAPVSHLEFNNLYKAVTELCSHGGRHVSKQEALALSYRR